MPTATEYPTLKTAPATAAEGYEITKKTIFKQVHKIMETYGGDFDDLLGEAHEFFMAGHARYTRGTRNSGAPLTHSYNTEIRRWVWYGLFDTMRTRFNRRTNTPMVPLGDMDFASHQRNEFHVGDVVAQLGPDARLCARLVLDTPEALEDVAEGKGGTACNYRSTVREYLKGGGWSPARINAAFDEIKNVLG